MVIKGIILSIFCSCASLVIHLFVNLFRKGRRANDPIIYELKRQTKLLFFVWSFTLLIYVWIFFQTPDKIKTLIERFNLTTEKWGFIYGLFLYLSLSLIYLCVYYFIDRSISATILEIIDNAEQKRLTMEEIKKAYPMESKYQKELKGMLDGGFLIKENEHYRNSFKGSLYAKIAILTKRLLKLGPGG